MKPCIHCGRELPDTASFCRSCGTKQSEPTFVSEKPAKKKSRVKKRLILLGVMLAVLSAAGIFAYRVLKHPSEVRAYDKDHNLCWIEYYDSRGRLTKSVSYHPDGNLSDTTEYRPTEAPAGLDLSEMKDMDGVKTVECVQRFSADGDEALKPDGVFAVRGYDWRGRLVAEQYFEERDGAYQMYLTITMELDAYGYPIVKTLDREDDDDLMFPIEYVFDNHYVFGRLVSSDRKVSFSGESGHHFANTLEYVY